MAKIPDASDAAKAAQKAGEAADKAKKAADKARKAVDDAAKTAEDAKKTAEKVKRKAEEAVELAKQAYALAKDPAMREQAFAAAKEVAAAADKAAGEAAKAFRDAADGANQMYSALENQLKSLSPQMIEEMIRQKIPAIPKLVPQGIAAKLGEAADALKAAAKDIPADLASAAARAANAVQMPAIPTPPTSPAVIPCAKAPPALPSLPKQQVIDDIVDAMGKNIAAHPLRQEYMQKVRDLKNVADNMLAAGLRESEVAETVSWLRRNLGEVYKEVTPEPLQSYIRAVNEKRYQDPLGPTYQALREKVLSNKEIIDKACRPNEKVDKLLGGFKKWLEKMPAEEVAELAEKVKKLKP